MALKIGLIVDSNFSSPYNYEIASHFKNNPDVVVSHLIIQECPTPQAQSKLTRIKKLLTSKKELIWLLERKLWGFINKLETYFLKKDPVYNNHLKSFNLNDHVANSLKITPQVSKSGFVYRYSEADVQKVKDLGLDVLIRCGSGILRGEILNSAKFGILSFHHADNKINRGGPAAFWEVYYKLDSTGFIIQKLTEELDGGEVLLAGSYQTQPYYLLNQAALYQKSNYQLFKILEDLAKTGKLPQVHDSVPYFNRLFSRPVLSEQIVYLTNFLKDKFYGYYKAYIKREHAPWSVAFSRVDWTSLVMWKAIKIPTPPTRFLADPFIIQENGRDYCFLEDYDYTIGKAEITVYELKQKTAERVGVALNEPFHLSFPFLFKFEGKLYMCPETNANQDIRIYECVGFPLEWRLKKIVKKEINTVDTMFFEKNGRWWMFTNIGPKNLNDLCSELHIFHADHPFSENWIPHAKNPVVFDALKARNGGLLAKGDDLYRVSQRQGFNRYGKGFSINKIVTLTPDEYVEKEVTSVAANFFPNLKGTHHIHSSGGVTVFDYL